VDLDAADPYAPPAVGTAVDGSVAGVADIAGSELADARARPRRRPPRSGPGARSQGLTVPERGRLRPDIWQAWRAAHPTSP
jgi:hypothetical protein